jgi:putative MFS transporter
VARSAHLTRSERRTVGLLAPATFFQGYDGLILGLALPLIQKEFGLTVAQAGVMVSLISAGSFGVLFLLPLADRYGRRPLLILTITGYTAATFLTAFSRGVVDFAGWQFLARVFMGAEYALAAIVLVELLPVERRGRALGLVSSMSAFGMAGAGVGFFVVSLTGASWRLLYLVGVAPLILVALARRNLPETATWVHAGGPRPPRGAFRASLEGVRVPWLTGAAVLAFLVPMFPTAVTTFATLLVTKTWGWGLRTVRPAWIALWIVCVCGFFVAGRLMDTWGRRPTALVFLLGAATAGFIAFRSDGTTGRVLGLGLVIFFVTGSTPAAAVFGIEPFPARARARVGTVVRGSDLLGSAAAPAMVGMLAGGTAGIGRALAIVGLSNALAAAVVATILPETRGRGKDSTFGGVSG